MRELRTVAVAILVVASATGCANMRSREWGGCAVAGALIGGTVGGITGGVAVNNADDDPTNSERGAGIGGGIVAGAALGALLGHAICDPEKTAPPPTPAAAAAPPPPAPGTKLGTVGSTFFDFDKAELKRGEAADVLVVVVKTMRDNPTLKVSVEGHTDSIGSEAYNEQLSERRANAVESYLETLGVSGGRVTAEGYGESYPVASNATDSGRQLNRRVDVLIKAKA